MVKAYIVGNGKSVMDHWPEHPMYATNKYPLWLKPDVYIMTSKHALKNWMKDCQERALSLKGCVLVWDTFEDFFPGCEPIQVDHNALWYEHGTYGVGGGSLFPLMQQAVLDGARELVLVGVDGFTSERCASEENHYDKDYFAGCDRNPKSDVTNAYVMAGHTEAAKQCRALGVKVTVLGNSMFADCYKEK